MLWASRVIEADVFHHAEGYLPDVLSDPLGAHLLRSPCGHRNLPSRPARSARRLPGSRARRSPAQPCHGCGFWQWRPGRDQCAGAGVLRMPALRLSGGRSPPQCRRSGKRAVPEAFACQARARMSAAARMASAETQPLVARQVATARAWRLGGCRWFGLTGSRRRGWYCPGLTGELRPRERKETYREADAEREAGTPGDRQRSRLRGCQARGRAVSGRTTRDQWTSCCSWRCL